VAALAKVQLTFEDFVKLAREYFPQITPEELDKLYPMVTSLRSLARDVSEIVFTVENSKLSDTAIRGQDA
jgi:hypothetical protein